MRFLMMGFFTVFLLMASSAQACSPQIRPISEYYIEADIVFLGKLERVEPVKNEDTATFIDWHDEDADAGDVEYLYFKPEKIWKGQKEKEIVLRAHRRFKSNCDRDFVKGKEYLIYANQTPTTATQNLYKANIHTYEMSGFQKTIAAAEMVRLDSFSSVWMLYLVDNWFLVLLVSILGIWFLFYRIRKSKKKTKNDTAN